MRRLDVEREDAPGPVRSAWLAQYREAALEPDRPIIDAHHHLFDHPGWRYLFEDYLADLDGSGHRVVASVFVQCFAMHRADGPEALRPAGETEFANGVAAMAASGRYGAGRVCAAIVGFADLATGARVEETLEAHLRAGGGRFRGVRQIAAWDSDPTLEAPFNARAAGLLDEPAFREGFARLGPLGLSFDAWLYSPQLGDLTRLARAFPDTTIVLDHLGTPPGVGPYAERRREVFDRWRTDIARLAESPNVVVKLGGMAQPANGDGWHERPTPPTSSELAERWRPHIETCLELFAPARCMFESNFPVDKMSCDYGVFWNACKRLTQGLDEQSKTALLAGTAARIYGLDLSETVTPATLQ